MQTRVYTELQKPELIIGVPAVFLFAMAPLIPGLTLILGLIFFSDSLHWVLLCSVLVALLIYVAGYVATKIDHEWVNTFLLALKTVPRGNWPDRNGKHYYG